MGGWVVLRVCRRLDYILSVVWKCAAKNSELDACGETETITAILTKDGLMHVLC